MDNQDPPVQVHWYNEHNAILRENRAYNHASRVFMYLYFGKRQGDDDRPRLDGAARPAGRCAMSSTRSSPSGARATAGRTIKLIVTQTHMHGDHYSGFAPFIGRPNTLLSSA